MFLVELSSEPHVFRVCLNMRNSNGQFAPSQDATGCKAKRSPRHTLTSPSPSMCELYTASIERTRVDYQSGPLAPTAPNLRSQRQIERAVKQRNVAPKRPSVALHYRFYCSFRRTFSHTVWFRLLFIQLFNGHLGKNWLFH